MNPTPGPPDDRIPDLVRQVDRYVEFTDEAIQYADSLPSDPANADGAYFVLSLPAPEIMHVFEDEAVYPPPAEPATPGEQGEGTTSPQG